MNKIYLTSIAQLPWNQADGIVPVFQDAPKSSLMDIIPAIQAPIRVEAKLHIDEEGGVLVANADGIVVKLDAEGKETGRLDFKGQLLDLVSVKGQVFVVRNESGATVSSLEAWDIAEARQIWRAELPTKGSPDDMGLLTAGEQVYLSRQKEQEWTLARVLDAGKLQPLPSPKPIVRRPIRVANGKIFSLTPVEGGFEAIQLNLDTWQNLSGKRYAEHPSLNRLIGLDKHGNLLTQSGASLSSFAANGMFGKEIRIFNIVHSPDGGFCMNVLIHPSETEPAVAGVRTTAEAGLLGPSVRIPFPEDVLKKRNLNNAYLVKTFENGDYLFESFDERRQSVLTRYSVANQVIVSEESGQADIHSKVERVQGLHTWVSDSMGNVYLLLSKPEGLEVLKMVME